MKSKYGKKAYGAKGRFRKQSPSTMGPSCKRTRPKNPRILVGSRSGTYNARPGKMGKRVY